MVGKTNYLCSTHPNEGGASFVELGATASPQTRKGDEEILCHNLRFKIFL